MKFTQRFCAFHLNWLLLFFAGLPLLSTAQKDPRDEYYTPPSNSSFHKVKSGDLSVYYDGSNDWALRFYPARVRFTTLYFGIERSLGKKFSISFDAGWHITKAGLYINAFGPTGLFNENIFNGNVFSTLTYSDLHARGKPALKNIPTFGFSGRYFPQKKEGHRVPFVQFQYQFTGSRFLMRDDQFERFEVANDTSTLILHTAMLRFGRQWTHGKKLKIVNEISMGIGINVRLSSAYQAVLISTGPATSTDNYSLNSLTGEYQRFFSPRFQLAYSIGIAY